MNCVHLFRLSKENCEQLLSLADIYGIERLKRNALQFIKDNAEAMGGWHNLIEEKSIESENRIENEELKLELPLTVENCIEQLWVAVTVPGNDLLRKQALQFLLANKEAVKQSDEWRRMMESGAEGKLKTLCGHYLMKIPLTVENCCEVLRIDDDFQNWPMWQRALDFFLENEAAVMATEGSRHLKEMDHWKKLSQT